MSENKFKKGDRVSQRATHPDRIYFGYVERIDNGEYLVRWHKGYASWEIESDLEAAKDDR